MTYTTEQFNYRLQSRLVEANEAGNPYPGPAGDDALDVGDLIVTEGLYAGFTERELAATPLLEIEWCKDDKENRNYLCRFWYERWAELPDSAYQERLKTNEVTSASQRARLATDMVNKRLASRTAYFAEHKGEYTGPENDMGLEHGDRPARAPGWTVREIEATPCVHRARRDRGDDFAARYVLRYWTREWTGEPDSGLDNLIASLKGDEARAREKAAERERRYIERYGPPTGYRAKTFDAFKADTPGQVAALAAVQNYPHSNPDGEGGWLHNMVLAGPTGTGKTHLIAAMFGNALEWNGGPEFITATALLRMFRENGTKESALLARYADGEAGNEAIDDGCRVLIVDDFGIDADAYAARIFCEILDRRTAADLYTVVTTNSTETELKEWLGERGFSRLMYRCKWVPVLGADHRRGTQQ